MSTRDSTRKIAEAVYLREQSVLYAWNLAKS
jgi:hypothetical protein